MSWNLNSIVKDNFHRVSLIEAHNSLFNYVLISICDSVELPETLLDEYTFVPVNNPANTRRGGVGLFYKNSLPVVIRNDLSFEESIVAELKFGRNKIFFTILYRSPAFVHNSPNFKAILSDFNNLYAKKSKQKILLRHFLQEILMLIPSFGGLMVTQLLKALKSNFFCLH